MNILQSYNDVSFSDRFSNVDDLFDRYNLEKENIISCLINNPDLFENYILGPNTNISIDNSCSYFYSSLLSPPEVVNFNQLNSNQLNCNQFNSNQLNCNQFNSNQLNCNQFNSNQLNCNQFNCNQCRSLDKLTDIFTGGIIVDNSVSCKYFVIESGKNSGKAYFITNNEISPLQVKYSDVPKSFLTSIFSSSINTKYLSMDEFMCKASVTWYCEYILKMYEHPILINELISIFVCDNIGNFLYEYPTIGFVDSLFIENDNKKNIEYNIIKGILFQLLSTLKVLSSNDLFLGPIGKKNIVLYNNPISYKYDGIKINCPITAKYLLNSTSSITIKSENGNTRIYQKSDIMENQIKYHSTLPYKNYNDDTYLLSPSDKKLYNYYCSLGFPFYISSYNVYSVFLVLMTIPEFFNSIRLNNENIFKKLWLPNEYKNVISDIKNNQEVHDIIKKYRLRKDALDFVWNNLCSE
jgi:hypothetical protein